MKRRRHLPRTACALAVLALVAPAAAGAAQGDAAEPQEAEPLPERPEELRIPPLRPYRPPVPETFQLEGGPRGLVLPDATRRFVDGLVLFAGGSAHEPDEHVGLARLVVDTLRAGGSAETPGRDLDRWLDRVGATLEIEVGREETTLRFRCLREDLEALLATVGGMLRAPAYPSDALESARERYLSELERAADDTATLADRALLGCIFGPDSPYAREPVAATLAGVAPEHLLAFHRAHLGPDRALFAITGPVSADEARALCGSTFDGVPPAGPLAEAPKPSFIQPASARVMLLDRPGVTQTELRLAAPGVRRRHRDYAALELWSWTIGVGGMTNRMMMRVRTELGLAYAVGAWHRAHWGRAGYLRGVCATRNEAVGRALEAMGGVLRSGLDPIPADELEASRSRLVNASVFEVDTSNEVLEREAALAFHGYPGDFWTRHQERLRRLTAEEVVEAAKRYLDPDRLIVVAVGPADEIEEQLAGFAPVTRVDAHGRVLDDATTVAALLAAVGGGEAWSGVAALRWNEVLSLSAEDGSRFELRATQWRALDRPWLRIDQELRDGSTFTTTVHGEVGWRSAGGRVEDLPADQVEDLAGKAALGLYPVLRGLARGALTAERAGPRALRILREGTELARLELDESSRPARLAFAETGTFYRYDGWEEGPGGLWFPARVVLGPQELERRIEEPTPLEALDAALFERPRGNR